MKERFCWLCESPINYGDYLHTNWEFNADSKDFVDINGDLLDKIWESKHIELWCCHCINVVKKLHTMDIEAFIEIMNKYEDSKILKLQQLGIVCKEDFVELKRVIKEEGL